MAEEVLIYLSFLLGLVTVLTIIARVIKQPPIIAHLIAGIIAGPFFLNILNPTSELIQVLANIGIAFLLFIVGLSLDFRVLKDVGGISIFAGLGQIIISTVAIFLISIGFGFSYIPAIYLGVAFAFSSTVVIVKILSDKKEMDTLHGRIALGILIIQDIIAALALMLVPAIEKQQFIPITFLLGKTILLIAVIFLFTTFILTRLLFYLAKNQELLLIFGIAWALIISTLFKYFGLSLEIGALIAGMSLASSKYTIELGGKMKPLRDFFIVLFFVYFGSLLVPPITSSIISNSIIFSLIIFIGNPIVVMWLMKLSGYKKRTNFLTGLSIAQISEFSLVLILLGFNLGHLEQEIISISILTALITIGLSSYSLYYSDKIYNKLSTFINIFEGNIKRHERHKKESPYDIVLFGCYRIGHDIIRSLKKMKAKIIVVDYNPNVIMKLAKKKINCIYGDANDREFIDELKLARVKMIISTIPHLESNLTILSRLKELGSAAIFIATSENVNDAIKLYEYGARFVIMPYHLGGEYASHLLEKNKFDLKKYRLISDSHLRKLKNLKNNPI